MECNVDDIEFRNMLLMGIVMGIAGAFVVVILFFTVILPILKPAGRKQKATEFAAAGGVVPKEISEIPDGVAVAVTEPEPEPEPEPEEDSRELLSNDVLAFFSGELSEGFITIGAGSYLFTLVRESSGFKVCISEGGTVLGLIPFSLSEREPWYTFGFREYYFKCCLSRYGVMSMIVTRKKEMREDNPNGDRK